MRSWPPRALAPWRCAGGRCRAGYASARTRSAPDASSPGGWSLVRATPACFPPSDRSTRPRAGRFVFLLVLRPHEEESALHSEVRWPLEPACAGGVEVGAERGLHRVDEAPDAARVEAVFPPEVGSSMCSATSACSARMRGELRLKPARNHSRRPARAAPDRDCAPRPTAGRTGSNRAAGKPRAPVGPTLDRTRGREQLPGDEETPC